MPKYPLWRYLIIVFAVAIAVIYSVPNLYGEVPAVQIVAMRGSTTIDTSTLSTIENSIAQVGLTPTGEIFDGTTLKLKFADTDSQLKARDILQQQLGSNYIVALNLVSNTPVWMSKINANPMFLGLDLRGGVHFLLALDMPAAIKKALDKNLLSIKQDLRNAHIRYGDITSNPQDAIISFRDPTTANYAYQLIRKDLSDIDISNDNHGNLHVMISSNMAQQIEMAAVKQNILILHNRVNELGVAEPIIQQQGTNRIMVELPGIQDTTRAKNILGRTATLEVHLVDDDPQDITQTSIPPDNTEWLNDADSNSKILVYRDVELTGDNITDAQPGFDENGEPAVNIRLDSVGAEIFKQVTRNNIGKRMAMVLVDNGKSQVVTAPVIRTEIGGGRVQISGAMDVKQANDVALLLRSGSLAAPMNIIEERTVGPSLGQENITRGFHAVMWGMIAIAVFTIIYYQIFGVIAVTSLIINLLLLIAALSMLQATLTLPGIAAIALALGMAIDANVLINERIREELRNGRKPHLAILGGYEHAWATILDSNCTTLIAGLALLAFGSGPIKGFAIVHCLGILSSMFSAVFVSRGIVAFLYRKNRINKLYI